MITLLACSCNTPSSSIIVTQDSCPVKFSRTVNLSFPSRPIESLRMVKLVHTRPGLGLAGNVTVRTSAMKSSPSGWGDTQDQGETSSVLCMKVCLNRTLEYGIETNTQLYKS